MEIETVIIQWFEKNSELLKTEIDQNLEKNYLLLGWIDSLKFVDLHPPDPLDPAETTQGRAGHDLGSPRT